MIFREKGSDILKRHIKFLFVTLTLLLICALCAACGGPAEGTEGNDTDSQAHQHVSAAAPTTVVEATCAEAGYSEYVCDTCGETYRVEIAVKAHEYGDAVLDRATGLEKITCTTCGTSVIQIVGADAVSFDANCKGEITLDFEVIGGPVEIEFLLDDFSMYKKTFEEGTHSATVARGLDESWYHFSIKQNNAGSIVNVTNIGMDGTITRKDAVILELNKKNDNNGTYEDFFVYVKTSDPSGKYYVRYNFIYEYSTEVKSKASSTDNIDAFRVKEAYLVEITSVTDTDVKYNKIMNVLQQGEIALAAREEGAGIVDFIGGYHGDDHMTAFTLKADGAEYTPGEDNIAVVCSTVEIFQQSTLNRCNQPDVPVMIHTQNYTIDAAGVKVDKSIEWVVDDFKSTTVYMQMFTLYRTACEDLMVLDGEGENPFSKDGDNILEDTDVKVIEEASKYADARVLSNKNNRALIYSSDKTGVSAKVGFEILEESCSVRSAEVQLRYRDAKDNKWYVNFTGADGNPTPKKGDVWKLDTYFDIDYVAPAN